MSPLRSTLLLALPLALACTEDVEPPADARVAEDGGRQALDAGGETDAGRDRDAGEDDDGGSAPDASTPPSAPCGDADPHRVFFQDFEGGEVWGEDRARHFQSRSGYSDAESYAVIPGEGMDGRAGSVLRGNMYELTGGEPSGARVMDPLAGAHGETVWGNKRPDISVRLDDVGIRQVPSADPSEPPGGAPAEVYVSFYFWMDDDFTFEARHGDGRIADQTVKMFYAFGPNDTMWVTTTHGSGGNHFLNMSGVWEAFENRGDQYYDHAEQRGHWRHWELYMRSETRPVFYEFGAFSRRPELLASDCPGASDYTIQFPVVGSDPMRCLSASEAHAMNSRDGVYVVRVDGEVVMDHRALAWNGRFRRIDIPAWHGGGGQATGNAGWAMDDFCVRSRAPEGFVPE